MVSPSPALAQMMSVSQQFLGMIPTGSNYFYNNAV